MDVRSLSCYFTALQFLDVKSDLPKLVDEFATRFYSELDYRCAHMLVTEGCHNNSCILHSLLSVVHR